MKYLLDTNICIYIARKRPPEVFKRVAKLDPGMLGISAITLFELSYGAINSSSPEKNLSLLEQFTLPFEIVPLTTEMARECADVRYELKHSPIGPMDTLIAGQARYLGTTLVTNNLREFAKVKGLRLENWVLERLKG